MEARLMGYLIALERATPQALKAAVRSYLCGEVEAHDGKFIPTSAELARVVRAEQAHLDKIVPRLRIVDAGRPPPSPEERARIVAKADLLRLALERTANDKLQREQINPISAALAEIADKAREQGRGR